MTRKRQSVAAPETDRAHECYDQLWSEAIPRIRAGRIGLDPVLQAGLPDRRRGLTVIARPDARARWRVSSFLEELRRLEPDQHYYTPSELHLTVLSLFTATEHFQPFLAEANRYREAVDLALHTTAPMRVRFKGVTASPAAVMVQGFLESDALSKTRDRLRRELRARGLDQQVDARYRLQTAHLTVVRFREPLRNPRRFALALERARQRDFGTTVFRVFHLVENDWYMSRRVTIPVKRYRLRGVGDFTRPGAGKSSRYWSARVPRP